MLGNLLGTLAAGLVTTSGSPFSNLNWEPSEPTGIAGANAAAFLSAAALSDTLSTAAFSSAAAFPPAASAAVVATTSAAVGRLRRRPC